AGVEADQPVAVLEADRRLPADKPPVAGERVGLVDARADDDPAAVLGPGARFPALHDLDLRARRLLLPGGGGRSCGSRGSHEDLRWRGPEDEAGCQGCNEYGRARGSFHAISPCRPPRRGLGRRARVEGSIRDRVTPESGCIRRRDDPARPSAASPAPPVRATPRRASRFHNIEVFVEDTCELPTVALPVCG